VLLCFKCKELEVAQLNADGSLASQPAHEDFDPAHAHLLKLAKEALPDDPVIQALQ